MIELVAARTQADFNVGQTFAISHLGEGHGEELIPAEEERGCPGEPMRVAEKVEMRAMEEIRSGAAPLESLTPYFDAALSRFRALTPQSDTLQSHIRAIVNLD